MAAKRRKQASSSSSSSERKRRAISDLLRPTHIDGTAPVRAREATEALRRLDEGEYGKCIDCGDRIPAARLRAKPEATRCLDCQEAAERVTDPYGGYLWRVAF